MSHIVVIGMVKPKINKAQWIITILVYDCEMWWKNWLTCCELFLACVFSWQRDGIGRERWRVRGGREGDMRNSNEGESCEFGFRKRFFLRTWFENAVERGKEKGRGRIGKICFSFVDVRHMNEYREYTWVCVFVFLYTWLPLEQTAWPDGKIEYSIVMQMLIVCIDRSYAIEREWCH